MTAPDVTLYVTIHYQWRERQHRWATAIGVSDHRPERHDTILIAWEVLGATRTEAPAIVMAWLVDERSVPPLSVKELWRR